MLFMRVYVYRRDIMGSLPEKCDMGILLLLLMDI